MKFCQDHWDRLRAAIEARGLNHLIAADGARAVAGMKDELETGKQTLANFDPLMASHWAIVNNVGRIAGQAGGSGAALEALVGDHCPLCYLNKAHEESCTDPRCKLDKKAGYDWMIDRAADDAKAKAAELLAEEKA